MLPLLMLIATPGPETAIEAERAFAQSAQTDGQWTAFRKFSTPDAVIFTPQPAKAHDVLPLKDPPTAIQWWPAESYVSCDGMVAVNTGPWLRPNAVGYFTTVWARQADKRFKWVYDGGDTLSSPRERPAEPKVRTASCKGKPPFSMQLRALGVTASDSGASPDNTLTWFWEVWKDGSRHFVARLWNGKGFDVVIDNYVEAPPPK